ncbi:acetyl/propionyl/methylcrotonyl-CoA carboxylase subunit alpha [Gemmobacter sp.]|uniref:acetyl/propionyl/methylcrotonyl-CoA carboxylase subunit alpha n=1 Tax=Gemmobacter sp. TaxID=1898957 RepID=UPI002AFE55FC|nr:biotin carboxylase N-terminal domain-containing protein [Gemmobacter sp.]
MKRVLIANRGEIAIRIARAARDCGMTSIGIHAEADSTALYLRHMDEVWSLGPGRPAETWLNIDRIINIAKRAGADAVHPGYGFLSERAEFARAVQDAGMIWIGPAPEVIELLGSKIAARRIAAQVGAPLVRGSDGALADSNAAIAFTREVGLPVAIKAAHGGGGRGMKVAWHLDEVAELYDSAVREAMEAFGRGECYAEQFLDKPRHVEAQIMADSHGNTLVLGTRDCSLQRRNQKLVEEAPAPFLTEDQRRQIHEAARAICAEVGYTGAGTVEFLVSRSGVISFLEVNTRLQVEHPVTEETTGLDIVVEQFRIAMGLPLLMTETPAPRGHALEFRINAEDPGRGFLPAPGRISDFRPPSGPGIRLDSGVEAGSVVPPIYDSMMAKLIVWGPDRPTALARARRALAEFEISGVASVLPFHRAVLDEPAFTTDTGFSVHTNWIETEFSGVAPAPRTDAAEEASLIRTFVEIDGKRHSLGLPADLFAALGTQSAEVTGDSPPQHDRNILTSPSHGVLQRQLVEEGANVSEGETVAILEAMKMEARIVATRAGRLHWLTSPGETLSAGSTIARVDS